MPHNSGPHFTYGGPGPHWESAFPIKQSTAAFLIKLTHPTLHNCVKQMRCANALRERTPETHPGNAPRERTPENALHKPHCANALRKRMPQTSSHEHIREPRSSSRILITQITLHQHIRKAGSSFHIWNANPSSHIEHRHSRTAYSFGKHGEQGTPQM